MTRPWLIVGCGYTGTQLARTLAAQPALAAEVVITRRDRDVARALGAALGVRGVRVDLAEVATAIASAAPVAASAPTGLTVAPQTGSVELTDHVAATALLAARGANASPAPLVPPVPLCSSGAIVVCSAPPGADPAAEIRALLALVPDAARVVYLSSTGVYGRGEGAWVDESWPVAPITDSGRARAAAEAALTGSPVPWVALRAAGIYGPGRGLVDRMRAGAYRVIGDGTSHVGRIHVVDLVAAIVRAGATDVRGAVNVADDDPAPIGEVADAVAARLGLPPPPRVPASSVSPEIAGMLTADRRIANRRMRDELGVVLRYPSWRDGVEAELAAVTAGGGG
jgi:nucleoside-diphosphate-sugar epimerase